MGVDLILLKFKVNMDKKTSLFSNALCPSGYVLHKNEQVFLVFYCSELYFSVIRGLQGDVVYLGDQKRPRIRVQMRGKGRG
jgi:hypothetical protein